MDWTKKVETPCYVIDEAALRKNLELLKYVREKAGCKILLAQKAFSAFAVYPLIAQYLDGVTASGIFEAKLGYEEMAVAHIHIKVGHLAEHYLKQQIEVKRVLHSLLRGQLVALEAYCEKRLCNGHFALCVFLGYLVRFFLAVERKLHGGFGFKQRSIISRAFSGSKFPTITSAMFCGW